MEERNYNRRYPKEYGFLGSLFYRLFLLIVVGPVGKLLYDIKIEGRENLEKGKKYLFAPNHVSYLDPPFTSLAADRKVAALRILFANILYYIHVLSDSHSEPKCDKGNG